MQAFKRVSRGMPEVAKECQKRFRKVPVCFERSRVLQRIPEDSGVFGKFQERYKLSDSGSLP